MPEPSIPQLRELLHKECDLLINVAVRETAIKEAEAQYRELYGEIQTLSKELGFHHDNPHFSLWGFWDQISRWGTYSDRREEVFGTYAQMFKALDDLEESGVKVGSDLIDDLGGWPNVDNQVVDLRKAVGRAETTQDWQDVGYRCRSILLALCNTLFIEDLHQPDGEEPIKGDDFTNKMEQVIKVELAGKEHERLRSLIQATWGYVNKVAHSTTTDERTGRLAAIATINFAEMSRLMIPIVIVEDGDGDADELRRLREEVAEFHQAAEDAYYSEGSFEDYFPSG